MQHQECVDHLAVGQRDLVEREERPAAFERLCGGLTDQNPSRGRSLFQRIDNCTGFANRKVPAVL